MNQDNKCLIKRNIFNFFKVFDCKACSNLISDETIIIGRNLISFYYLNEACKNIVIDPDIIFLKSNKLFILLKEAIIYQDNILFLILEDSSIDKYYEIFSSFLDLSIDIQIVVI